MTVRFKYFLSVQSRYSSTVSFYVFAHFRRCPVRLAFPVFWKGDRAQINQTSRSTRRRRSLLFDPVIMPHYSGYFTCFKSDVCWKIFYQCLFIVCATFVFQTTVVFLPTSANFAMNLIWAPLWQISFNFLTTFGRDLENKSLLYP